MCTNMVIAPYWLQTIHSCSKSLASEEHGLRLDVGTHRRSHRGHVGTWQKRARRRHASRDIRRYEEHARADAPTRKSTLLAGRKHCRKAASRVTAALRARASVDLCAMTNVSESEVQQRLETSMAQDEQRCDSASELGGVCAYGTVKPARPKGGEI